MVLISLSSLRFALNKLDSDLIAIFRGFRVSRGKTSLKGD